MGRVLMWVWLPPLLRSRRYRSKPTICLPAEAAAVRSADTYLHHTVHAQHIGASGRTSSRHTDVRTRTHAHACMHAPTHTRTHTHTP